MNTDPNDEVTSEDTKNVYAYFGRAYYFSECVFRGVIQFLATSLPSMTRPRVEERLVVLDKLTLGALIAEAEGKLPEPLQTQLRVALPVRNFLAHGFWFERVFLMSTASGLARMVEELEGYSEQFESISKQLDEIAFANMQAKGVTPEQWEEIMVEAERQPMEPLPDRPPLKPGAKLQIESAWLVQKGHAQAIIFVDTSRACWQLCDAGLGWAYFEPQPDWLPCEPLAKHLPATMDARPKGVPAWNFDLHLSTGVTMKVRKKPEDEHFRWTVQPTKPAAR